MIVTRFEFVSCPKMDRGLEYEEREAVIISRTRLQGIHCSVDHRSYGKLLSSFLIGVVDDVN
jgi:hypothetical protein